MQIPDSPIRLDQTVQKLHPQLSRNQIQKLIKEGHITINNKPSKKNYLVQSEDELTITIPSPQATNYQPIKMDLEVLYEDDDLIAICKPAGLSVHPRDEKDPTPTLVNGLLEHCGESLSGIGGKLRPGIVHRLDKDTSGIILVAKNDHAHQNLSAQFSKRTIQKIYTTLVVGEPESKNGQIEAPIARDPHNRQKMAISNTKAAKDARTDYKIEQILTDELSAYSLCQIQLHTGRTHQIRVHMQAIGHPIVGDQTYGQSKFNEHFRVKYRLERQFLHASQITFTLPKNNKKLTLKSPLPSDLANTIKNLDHQN